MRHTQEQNTVLAESSLLKFGKAENPTRYGTRKIFNTTKNTLPHLTDTINHYVHQYQKVLH